MRTCLLALAALAALAAADDAAPAAAAAEPKKPSTLAPLTKFLDLWAFLHGKDPKMPKVLYLANVGGDGEVEDTPSWVSSAAMAFKDGRTKTASFAAVHPNDSSRTASRLGVKQLPALVAVQPDGNNGGTVWTYAGPPLHLSSGGTLVRAAKEFVNELVAGSLSDDDGFPLPAFPEPTRPRKQASVSLEELTHETLPQGCYDGGRLCFLGVTDELEGKGCPTAMEVVAKKYRNDPVRFGCVGAKQQVEFLKAFGLEPSQLPALLALKGKPPRKRTARMDGAFEVAPIVEFVEQVLTGGGGVKLAAFKGDLPDLEAPYLLEKQEL